MVAIDEKEKNMLETVILQAKLSKEPAMLYNVYQQQYLPLVKAAGGDEYVAQLYAGKFADDMAVYHKLAGGGALDASNQGAAYNEVVLPRAKELPSNVRNKEIIAELTTWKPVQYLPFTGYALRDPAGYAAELGPYLKSGLPVDGAIKYAVAQSKDLNRMAGYHWRTQSGNTSLSNWLAKKRTVGTDNMEEALDITVKLLSEKGGLVGNVSIAQTTDTATGEPQLYLRGLDDKDNVRLINFTGSDVEASWLSGKGRMSADDFRAGGGLAVRAPDGLPSGSDSPEVWAAYRKKQALDKATKQNKVRKQ
jgi:hypothetical protein